MRACDAIAKGARTLVISDRDSDHTRAPIPSLLAVSAVHHHLVRTKERTTVALVVESGDAREVHHIAMLIGFGAAAVNPYLAFESIEDLIREGELTGIEPAAAVRNYLKALGKGVMKVMSKMGISTVASYTAAQAFEAVGIDKDVIDEYFTGTPSQLGGVGLDVIAEEVKQRHRRAYPENPTERVHRRLEVGGEYAFRREGELHLFTPEVVFLLQHSTRTGRHDVFEQYSDEVNRLSREGGTLRGLFEFKKGLRPPVPLEEVEPVESIVTRFNTGAMSYGSISAEAHETMAIAMNNLGGRSNSGEGGEDVDRLYDPKRRSAVKQVASGRFGVTSDYLVNATDIQIKMAQGAKPGEGGQLPGFKVYPNIAKTRHSTPGVGLISPAAAPRHLFDRGSGPAHPRPEERQLRRPHPRQARQLRRCRHRRGRGVQGARRRRADLRIRRRHRRRAADEPQTRGRAVGDRPRRHPADADAQRPAGPHHRAMRRRHAHRTRRDRRGAARRRGVRLRHRAAGGVRLHHDAGLPPRHLSRSASPPRTPNCEPRFNGKPEFVENFFRFIAEDIRRYLAELGFRSIDEAVGHAEMLDTDEGVAHWKSKGLDLTPVFAVPRRTASDQTAHAVRDQDHGLDQALDRTLIQLAEGALEDAHPVRLELPVRNVNRTVGTLLGSEVTRRYGAQGLPDDTIHVTLTGSAGQSIGAFLPPGITLELIGDANDYVGKGLSGGRVIVRPPDDVLFLPEDNVIAGNTLLFGATSGEVYLRGRVGERFAARNSGALTVVEGVGDHACEYMTGGRVVVLGQDRPQHGGGHVRRHRIRARPRPREGQHRDGRAAAPRARGPDLAARRHRQARRATPAARWPPRCCPTGQGAVRNSPRSCPRDYQRVLEATLVAKRGGPRRRHRDHGGQPWLIRHGFLKVPKVEAAKRPVDERVGDWREVYELQDPHQRAGEVSQQARRCMDCGIPFCHSGTAGCPLGNLIPEWNDLVRRGRWDAASDRLHATNNFPEFTGRLCPAPCEAACVLSIAEEQTGGSVTIKRIEQTIADQAWMDGIVEPQPAAISTGKKVAVVGSGPAGLAAAQQLTRAGHDVTVYERDDRIGGLMRYGIPEYKLEKAHAEPATGPNAGGGNPFRHRMRGRGRPDRRAAARAVRRRRARRRCAEGPRQRGRGPAPRRACTWRWSTWCPPTRSAKATGRARSPPRASTS